MVNWKKLKNSIPHFVQVSKKGIYEILYTDDFLDGNTLGETRFDPKQIVIKNNLSAKKTVEIYEHELFHAISFEFGGNLTESQVLALEKSTYYRLKVNNLYKSETKNVRKRRKQETRTRRRKKIRQRQKRN